MTEPHLEHRNSSVEVKIYDPYGNFLTANPDNSSVDFRFAGQYRSTSLSLYKMGLRWYDPKVGRWTQADPVDQASDLREGNGYGYVGGDPVNLVDLTGEHSCLPKGGAGTPAQSCPGTGASYSGGGGRPRCSYQPGGCGRVNWKRGVDAVCIVKNVRDVVSWKKPQTKAGAVGAGLCVTWTIGRWTGLL